MRTDLKVPYEEKDAAKAHGARWDAARKVWFIENMEDLTPFMRWMPPRHAPLAASLKPGPKGQNRLRVSGPKFTLRTDFSLPECACKTPPWEHCEHTIDPALSGDELAHIQSILTA